MNEHPIPWTVSAPDEISDGTIIVSSIRDADGELVCDATTPEIAELIVAKVNGAVAMAEADHDRAQVIDEMMKKIEQLSLCLRRMGVGAE